MGIQQVVADLRRDDRLAAARILEEVAFALKTEEIDANVVYLLAMKCGQAEQLNQSLTASLEGINASLSGM